MIQDVEFNKRFDHFLLHELLEHGRLRLSRQVQLGGCLGLLCLLLLIAVGPLLFLGLVEADLVGHLVIGPLDKL